MASYKIFLGRFLPPNPTIKQAKPPSTVAKCNHKRPFSRKTASKSVLVIMHGNRIMIFIPLKSLLRYRGRLRRRGYMSKDTL